MQTPDQSARRNKILDALHTFARSRPGLEFGNYGDVSAYRAEARSILRDLHDAETLLRAVSWRESIDADALLGAARSAYPGRLSMEERADGTVLIDYCPGQSYPTEYRRAVCAVLAAALWAYTREGAMPKPTLHHNSETGELVERYKGLRADDWLRAYFKREFGARIARRWFD